MSERKDNDNIVFSRRGLFFDDIKGKEIEAATYISDDYVDAIELTFTDGKKVRIQDTGRQCCERRYITVDDDLSCLVGGKITDIVEKGYQNEDLEDGDTYEAVFIDILTDKSFVTFTAHNAHNGYYSGFEFTLVRVKK